MSKQPSPGGLTSLSVGDVVSGGLRVYRDHFKSYLWLAGQAYLWLLAPFLITVLGVTILAGLAAIMEPIALAGLIILAIAILLVPWGYCLGKFFAVQGVLARLVFFEVGEQPETVAAAKIQLMPRFWRFLWVSLLTSLVFFLFLIPIMLGYGVVFAVFAFLFTANDPGVVSILLAALLTIVWSLISLYIYIWAFARLALVDVCLALEPTLSPLNAVGRSWALTKGYVLSLQLIFFLAFLITLPLSMVTNLGSITTLILDIDPVWGSVIDVPLSLIISVLIVPFWQAIKALVYYDLRTRKEGLNLSLDLPTMDSF
ncbi:hypothetical protein [Synechocystis salina]|uniref:Glycerophosphoryl diester phosphodiesterase membrane domain-containing protein n=1 Tax=Synechocystis salina LEGE 00031 TaxID=1828736 RepID=A0ABR9VN56_9SYNC|nr:hypothetical protein [Synechocystis salina]MBE9241277.1 hypothetical protein [Synechocystis salina LEGE 00041]MBE9252779.1 hypothetical protein [Synechocystis salina LEGE 00031]